MGIFTWEWRYYIAPAPIIEKQFVSENATRSFRHWGMYISKKVFRGFKHPKAGDVVSIPDYGACKVERVLYWANFPSRSFTLGIVISPRSLGDDSWWVENKNNPVAKHSENWNFDIELPRSYFKDLEIPANDYLD